MVLVGKGKKTLSSEEEAQRRRYGDEVMEVLRAAIVKGLRDPLSIKTASEFVPLHPRADFQNLVAQLQKTAGISKPAK
jgi:hypothetical protein